MNSSITKELYVDNGFFWNQHLAELIAEYGGKEIPYSHPKTKKCISARFFPSDLVSLGRKYDRYQLIAKFLKEEIAPVGDCNNKYIELFLTESGKLIGFADYLLLRWGPEGSDWRSSLRLLLGGNMSEKIGVIE